MAPYNKQLQRTVRDKVPAHMRQRAAAELRRYAADPAHRSSQMSAALGVETSR